MGIFRLAPNAQDNTQMKLLIDSGKFAEEEKRDMNVYANLIKVWFRDLPKPLLSGIKPELVEMARNEKDVIKVINLFTEPHQSIFIWLCDLCCDCAVYEKINKMGPQVFFLFYL